MRSGTAGMVKVTGVMTHPGGQNQDGTLVTILKALPPLQCPCLCLNLIPSSPLQKANSTLVEPL